MVYKLVKVGSSKLYGILVQESQRVYGILVQESQRVYGICQKFKVSRVTQDGKNPWF